MGNQDYRDHNPHAIADKAKINTGITGTASSGGY
jgi:hypothetical protein